MKATTGLRAVSPFFFAKIHWRDYPLEIESRANLMILTNDGMTFFSTENILMDNCSRRNVIYNSMHSSLKEYVHPEGTEVFITESSTLSVVAIKHKLIPQTLYYTCVFK